MNHVTQLRTTSGIQMSLLARLVMVKNVMNGCVFGFTIMLDFIFSTEWYLR